MSWQHTALVKVHFVGSPALKLLAMVLADYADPEGGSIRPSVHTLAAVTGLSDRTVARMMAQLREMGFVERVNAGKGGAFRRDGKWVGVPASYVIGYSWIKDHPANLAWWSSTTLTPKAGHPDKAVTDEDSIEPTMNPPSPASAAGASVVDNKVSLKSALLQWRQRDEKAFGEGDRIFRMRVAAELLEAQWCQFKRVHEDGRERRTPDGWRTAFRRTVRSNVYGLWTRHADGSAVATQRGRALIESLAAEVSHAE